MMFNILKHKSNDTSHTYEGRVISDEEIDEMIHPKKDSFIKSEMNEIKDMFEQLKNTIDNGRK